MKSKCRWIVFLLVAICLLDGCQINRIEDKISKDIGIQCKGGTSLYEMDTHGGFHGDGLSFYVFEFEVNLSDQIVSNSEWKRLPLDETASVLIYGDKKEAVSVGPYVTNEKGDPLFPVIGEGYYYFEDRIFLSSNHQIQLPLLERASFNFTIAIYDETNCRLYYCQFDT